MHCSSCSDEKLLKKAASGLYSARIEKQGRKVSDTRESSSSRACCCPAFCWRHTCAHSTTCTLFTTLAVLFLSAAFFKMMDTNPGLSCCLPLRDTPAFPHTHVTESRSGRPQTKVLLGAVSFLLLAGGKVQCQQHREIRW